MTEFRARVTLETAIALAALAGPAAWLGGQSAAVGVLAAGGLTVGNFWWLSRAATAAGAPGGAPPQVSGWVFAAGIRFLVLFAAFGALCVGGYAHPVAIVIGLTVLPFMLIAQGLRNSTVDLSNTPGSNAPGGGYRAGGAGGGRSPLRSIDPAFAPPDL